MGTRDKRVDAYIARSREFARPILERIRETVHAACPEVEETLKWGMPTFMHHGMVCGMAAFQAHAALWFWKSSGIVERSRAVGGAMGEFGRLTRLADLPSKRELAGYVKKAAARNEAARRTPRPAAKRAAAKRPPVKRAGTKRPAAERPARRPTRAASRSAR